MLVFVSMFIALLLKVGVSSERASSQNLLAVVLVVTHVSMVFAIVVQSVAMAYSVTVDTEDDPEPRATARPTFSWHNVWHRNRGVCTSDGVQVRVPGV